ncbi:uncharacterized protein [Misgurnus anguillicaudatus]|uniref:uncharacterized protein isoform X2 n=1 Tax=Misgurnus anguillicaudatus TaxID=75329 RepID=UPI003CCF9F8F
MQRKSQRETKPLQSEQSFQNLSNIMSSSRLPFEGKTDELKDVHGLEVSGCSDRFPELIHVQSWDPSHTADGKFMKVSRLRHAVDESSTAGWPLTNIEAGTSECKDAHGLDVGGRSDRFPQLIHVQSRDSSLSADGKLMKVSPTHTVDESPKAGPSLNYTEGLEASVRGGRVPDLNNIQSRDAWPSTSRKREDSPNVQRGEGRNGAGICGFIKGTWMAAKRHFLSRHKVEPFAPPLQPDTSFFNPRLSVPCASDARPVINDSAARVWSMPGQTSDADLISGADVRSHSDKSHSDSTYPSYSLSLSDYGCGVIGEPAPMLFTLSSDSFPDRSEASCMATDSSSSESSYKTLTVDQGIKEQALFFPVDECGADQRKDVDRSKLFSLSSNSFFYQSKESRLSTESSSSESLYETNTVENSTKEEPTRLDSDHGMKEEIATTKKQTGICGYFKRKWDKAMQTLNCCFKGKVEPMEAYTTASNEALFEPTEGVVESYYKFGKLLGEGGFGLVRTGTRISDGKEVAIKIISRRLSRETIVIPGYSKPLPVEVALLIKMNQAPISQYAIKMLEWFIDSQDIVIIMEYPQPCQSLSHIMKRNRTLSEETARVIMRQTVQAVINCYDHDVFHSDIHPGNFLVNTETLDTKLIDFGCGQLYTDGVYKSHKYIGLKDFIPPEVRKNRKFHAIPANVWGLGMVLYEMVNGYKSYVKSKEVQFANTSLSEECCSLIRQCLARDPAERPSLQQILQHRWFNPE